MGSQKIFKRYELKYSLTKQQYEMLKEHMKAYMIQDEYGKYRIHNIYMDTDDYRLIRRSIEKPQYKEKLRIRAYGHVTNESSVFLELKKKYQGVVYKRRVAMTLEKAYDYLLQHHEASEQTQITKEIDYFVDFYEGIEPRILLSYDREAYKGIEDNEFRITFDQNITIQDNEVCFLKEGCGQKIISDDTVILEVKTVMGLPEWLLKFFGENQIFKTSFSKYGTAYKTILLPKKLGGTGHVA